MNVEHLLKESKKNAKYMGEETNIDFIFSTFSVLSETSEDKAKNTIYDYLHSKFMKSDYKNFDAFIEKELTSEEGVQIKSDIPRSAIPEQQPEKKKKDLEEGTIYYEEDDEENNKKEDGDGSEEESSEEESPSGEEENSTESEEEINSFLDKIGLSDMEENQAMVFLERFKSLLEDVIDSKEVKDLIIYLLYKAWSGSLSEGETLELKDLIKQFDSGEQEEDSDKEEKKDIEESYSYLFEKEDEDMSVKKIGVISSIVGSTLLFGVGGLLVSGLVAAVSGSSEEDFAKQKSGLELDKMKFELDKNKIEFQNKLKKDAESTLEKNKNNPAPEQKSSLTIDTIVKDGESAKDTAVNQAKEEVKNQTSEEDGKEKETPKPENKEEPESSKEEPSEDKDAKAQEKEDEKNLDPQQFHKKYDKCPKGWNWDAEKNACVQVDKSNPPKKKKKKESIDYQVLLF